MIDHAQQELRKNTEHEHQRDGGSQQSTRSRVVRSGKVDHLAFSGPLKTRCKTVRMKIAVISRPRTESAAAHMASEKTPFENQKFADETVQAGQAERGK